MLSLSTQKQKAFAISELCLVAGIVLGLASVVFVVFQSYQTGANRSRCVGNIASVQRAVRSFQTTRSLETGVEIDRSGLIGKGKVFEIEPSCPCTGKAYLWKKLFPKAGVAVATCPHAEKKGHIPTNTDGW